MSFAQKPLGDLCQFLSGGTPRMNAPQFWNGSVPWVSAKDMHEGRVYDSELRVTESAIGNGTRLVPPGTILCVVRGMSLAKDFRVAIARRPMTFNQDLKALVVNECIVPEFLYYALVAMRNDIKDRATDASHGTKRLETDVLKAIPIPTPEKELQHRIVDVISAYDDLIENNRRRIQLLENAARLMYREWFVYLRFPGHEHVKISGGVPEGWERMTFADASDTVGGGTPSTGVADYWDGDITWVVPTDITRNGSLALLGSARKITDKRLRESSAQMLPSDAILMTSRASVGFFGLADAPVCTNQGFINIIPKLPSTRFYLLHNLLSRVEEIRNHAAGSTYPEISKSRFRSLPVVIPPLPIRQAFEEIAESTHRLVRNLEISTDKLTKARDLLLPRLMSGEVEV
jgi:type I restriction enzyme S subunit